MNDSRHFGLPHSRRINTGRTFSSAWDPARYGSAIERPMTRRGKMAHGLCWVCAGLLFALALSAPWWLR